MNPTKRVLLTLCALVLCLKLQAQSFTEQTFLGRWRVTGFSLAGFSPEERQKAQQLKASFMKAQFVFRGNERADFLIDFSDLAIRNQYWSYSPAKNLIRLLEWGDRKSVLMEIRPLQQNGKMYFLLEETPFKLEVQRF